MSERELSTIDKLVETESETNDDGTVNVEITSWRECEGDNVVVEFETPTGDIEKEVMGFPQPGGDLRQYKFYRLLKSAGLQMNNADLLAGERVRADVHKGDWSLVVEKSKKERLSGATATTVEEIRERNWKEIIITAFWMVCVLAIALSAVLMAI